MIGDTSRGLLVRLGAAFLGCDCMSVLATFSARLLAERSMPKEDAWWTGTAGGDNKSGVRDACDCAALLGCARLCDTCVASASSSSSCAMAHSPNREAALPAVAERNEANLLARGSGLRVGSVSFEDGSSDGSSTLCYDMYCVYSLILLS